MSTDLSTLYTEAARSRMAPAAAPPAPVIFDFDAGWPAPETFPIDEFKALAVKVLDDRTALGYRSVGHDGARTIYHSETFRGRQEMSFGYTPLREEVAGWIAGRDGLPGLSVDNVILTSGATQAISLAAAAFVEPGEGALIEALTYSYAAKSLELRGADVRRVALDDDGMDVGALEERLREFQRDGVRPKLLYTIPSFHLPTGTVLPLERRERLLELAEEWDLIVIEDAMYTHLRYDGPELPPSLLSLDRSGRVLQAHSFSKTVAPGLRLGWITGPQAAVSAMGVVREDLGVSQWLCRIVAEFMADGRLDPMIEHARGVYRHKRDVAVEMLREHGGELVRFNVPNGGFYLWVQLDDAVDWDRAQRLAAEQGVAVRAANVFAGAGTAPHFRLGFGHTSDEELRTGVPLLGAAIRAAAGVRA
jgi:2-aminoadipate transaminase